MKFNLLDCMENVCLLCGVLCIEFAVESGLKNTIGLKKPVVINSEIDIQLVSAKYFFWIAQKKDIKVTCGYHISAQATMNAARLIIAQSKNNTQVLQAALH